MRQSKHRSRDEAETGRETSSREKRESPREIEREEEVRVKGSVLGLSLNKVGMSVVVCLSEVPASGVGLLAEGLVEV